MTHAPPDVGRTSVQLLLDRTYGPFFWGKTLSTSGMWVQNITAAVLVFELTRSATAVGMISVAQFAGPMLLSLFSGALTDRVDRRRLLMVGRATSAAGAAWLAAYVLSGALAHWQFVWPVFVGTGILGIGLGLSAPAMHALVPALVPRADLEQAVALTSVTGNIARAVGPAVGALLLLQGPGLAFVVATLSHVCFLAALATIPMAGARVSREQGRVGVLGGLRFALADRKMAVILLGVAAIGIGVDPVVTLTPALAEHFGAGSALVGGFASAFGAGAVATVFFVRRIRHTFGLRHLAMAGFVVLGIGQLIVAASPTPALAVAGFAVSGSGFLLGTTGLTTRVQRRIPEELRGRIMALWTIAFLGSRPVGAAFNGVLADLFSVHVALLCGAVIAFASTSLASVRYGSENPAGA